MEDIIRDSFLNPSFYEDFVEKVNLKETHISLVFLTGKWVYKIKKPVDFGFIDYTTPELRRYYCHREVSLNKRLAKDVYTGVLELCKNPEGRLFLGSCKEPLEWVVKMKELPEKACFRNLLEAKKIRHYHTRTIAKKLARFYSENSVLSYPFSYYGTVEYVRFNTYENFYQLEPFANEIGGIETLKFLKKLTSRFTILYNKLFKDRLLKGYVVDGHGDLRVDHLYFYKGLQIIDCIEFNDRFRFGDLSCDLAFLFMDMKRLGYEDGGFEILKEYVKLSGDLQFWFLLDFYTAYRAIVRAKVSCLETLGGNRSFFEDARKFMKLGILHTLSYGIPTVWVFMGLPASGKTCIAKKISELGFLPYLSSDEIRKTLFPQSTVTPYGSGFYTLEARQRIYEKIFEEALKHIKRGMSVVVDATFSSRKWREALVSYLSATPCYIFFIETKASKEVLEKRLLERESKEGIYSDARIEHLEKFMANYEPPSEVPPENLIDLDTSFQSEFDVLTYLLPEILRRRFSMSESIYFKG